MSTEMSELERARELKARYAGVLAQRVFVVQTEQASGRSLIHAVLAENPVIALYALRLSGVPEAGPGRSTTISPAVYVDSDSVLRIQTAEAE